MSNSNGQTEIGKRFHSSVKWFNSEKGYGFIHKPQGYPGEKDVFLHAKVLPDGVTSLVEGTQVSFDIVQGKEPGLYKAVNVQIK